MRKRIFIHILGCRKRSLDASLLGNYFLSNGCILTNSAKDADYTILIACAVTKTKEDECFTVLEELKKYSGELIVLGCVPAIAQTRLKKVFIGKSLSTKDLQKIDAFFIDFKTKFTDVPDANVRYENSNFLFRKIMLKKIASPAFLSPFSLKGFKKVKDAVSKIRKRIANRKKVAEEVLLRIARGCTGNCSYCVVPLAVGKIKSKPLEICLNELRSLLKRGIKKIRIEAEDSGAYGLDIKSSFSELLYAMAENINGHDCKIYIGSLNPWWALRYKEVLLELTKKGKIFGIQLMLQSGSKRVLKLMKRFVDIEEILKFIFELKRESPNLLLSTNFLIGFPSETQEDFSKSVDLIKRIKFDEITVFFYSSREGAETENWPNKISPSEMQRRSETIQKEFRNTYDISTNLYRLLLEKRTK